MTRPLEGRVIVSNSSVWEICLINLFISFLCQYRLIDIYIYTLGYILYTLFISVAQVGHWKLFSWLLHPSAIADCFLGCFASAPPYSLTLHDALSSSCISLPQPLVCRSPASLLPLFGERYLRRGRMGVIFEWMSEGEKTPGDGGR